MGGNEPMKDWDCCLYLEILTGSWIIQQVFFFFLFSFFLYKMTSLTMTPSEILELNLNDSALDLLNAAIASHQVKLDQDEQDTTEDEATLSHGKLKKKATGYKFRLTVFIHFHLFLQPNENLIKVN